MAGSPGVGAAQAVRGEAAAAAAATSLSWTCSVLSGTGHGLRLPVSSKPKRSSQLQVLIISIPQAFPLTEGGKKKGKGDQTTRL